VDKCGKCNKIVKDDKGMTKDYVFECITDIQDKSPFADKLKNFVNTEV